MKPTQGPWEQAGSVIFAPGAKVMICELSEPCAKHVHHEPVDLGSNGWKRAMANGQLIVAAPDLLEACEQAARFLCQVQKAIENGDLSQLPNESQRLGAENNCWAAIALAKGKEEA